MLASRCSRLHKQHGKDIGMGDCRSATDKTHWASFQLSHLYRLGSSAALYEYSYRRTCNSPPTITHSVAIESELLVLMTRLDWIVELDEVCWPQLNIVCSRTYVLRKPKVTSSTTADVRRWKQRTSFERPWGTADGSRAAQKPTTCELCKLD
ncbi:hypothetical protein BDV97DRAFT_97896 [Delphinella strobiligena]|nr:hypothetical protein BDV97DRAFT_97896 [Delphinella strobiligena]